ncbi:MAG: hypothetical protein HC895_06295 [Leptolyngbyaceae cyanobacterium SM1_3_5]|nr:hypothetical protein [Leptolyngbyaceae cyanobacterium SM1_3_5]
MKTHETMLEPEELISTVILAFGKRALPHQHGLTIPMHRNKVEQSVSCRGYLCPVIGVVVPLCLVVLT